MARRDLLLWIAVVLGPLAWFADLTISYAVTPEAYQRGDTTALRAITAAVVLAPIAGAAIGWSILRRLGEDDHRPRLVALGAIWVSALSLLLVVATAIPKWLIEPGAEP